MQREFARHERVAAQLRRELATLIQREVNDPRLGPVTVTDVEVTRDLSVARVYLSSASPETIPGSLKVLKGAAGFLRSRLGRDLRMRAVPELRFVHDDSMQRGARIDSLLDGIKSSAIPIDSESPGESGEDPGPDESSV